MVKIVTPPTAEPVTLDEFKAWMRGIPISAEQEGMVNTLLQAGREEAERYQNAAYLEQTLQITLDALPQGTAVLPRPPYKELVSVVLYGADGSETDVTECFTVSDIPFPAELRRKEGAVFPTVAARCHEPVVVTYKAGADTVPERVRHAILLYASWAYLHPSGDEPIPDAFYSLLKKGRVPL